MPPRAPTAYFLFAAEQRSKVQEELAARNGEKVGVAAVAKAIGERWQQLSDEEKDQYKKLAAEKAEALRGVFLLRLLAWSILFTCNNDTFSFNRRIVHTRHFLPMLNSQGRMETTGMEMHLLVNN